MHLSILMVAAASAGAMWIREDDPAVMGRGDVTVWSSRLDDVGRIRYEGGGKKVVLTAKTDAVGRYFIGAFEDKPPPLPAESDAPGPTSMVFVSVTAGEAVAKAFAPFKALRAIGKLDDARAKEFGFDGEGAAVVVDVGDTEHRLALGDRTIDNAERYIREQASGEVYAVKNTPFELLESVDTNMVERAQHEWGELDVTRAKIFVAGEVRDITRVTSGERSFWADSARARGRDETLANWMSKVEHLIPVEYVSEVPPGQTVLRVEYGDERRALGFIELLKARGAGGRTDYFLQTERTRLFARVEAAVAEQVEQDTALLVR